MKNVFGEEIESKVDEEEKKVSKKRLSGNKGIAIFFFIIYGLSLLGGGFTGMLNYLQSGNIFAFLGYNLILIIGIVSWFSKSKWVVWALLAFLILIILITIIASRLQ